MAPVSLLHPQINADLHDVEGDIISKGQYRPTDIADCRRLWSRETISDIWPEQPSSEHLHVFVSLPSGVSTADDARGECFVLRIAPAQEIRLRIHACSTQPNLMTLTNSLGT